MVLENQNEDSDGDHEKQYKEILRKEKVDSITERLYKEAKILEEKKKKL